MRADLASLDDGALVLLANKGLVRRATRMLAAGEGPTISEQPDGTVAGVFPDGVVLRWPPGAALAEVACSCGAVGVCRHGVAVALAYEGEAQAAAWSPGALDDAALQADLGPRALAAARRWVRDGLVVRIERGPPPTAFLPGGTVRFVAGDALHLAHCDVIGPDREATIAVAAWAFRQADRDHPGADRVEVSLGDVAEADASGLEAVLGVVEACLDAGMAHLPQTLRGDLAAATRRAQAEGWLWVQGALEELEAQWDAHGSRSAAYSSVQAASVLAELVARVRTGHLGAGVAPETKLDHVVLLGLGARVVPDGVEVYLLDRAAGTVLVLSRVSGRLSLGALAVGELATRGARRSASRRVTLGAERGGRKHGWTGASSWADIPAPVQVTSAEALRSELASRPPRCLRPRRLAEDLRVVPIAHVHQVVWSPGAQELLALCTLPSGDPLRLELAHEPAAPGACGALQAALEAAPTHVAGHLRIQGNVLVMRPTAVAGPGGVVAPALAEARPVTAPVGRVAGGAHPLTRVLQTARARLADLAHLGLGHEGARRAVEATAGDLAIHGLRAAAGRIERAAGGGGFEAWADAWLTVEVATESVH